MSSQAIIIDDDRLSVKVLETLLRQEGMSVTSIDNPADVSAKLTELPAPNVVFLDLEMPHLDGYEVLDLLRQRLGNEVLVAAYTVHTSEAVAAMGKGFDGFFGKPLNMTTFPGNLKRLLNGERVWVIQ